MQLHRLFLNTENKREKEACACEVKLWREEKEEDHNDKDA